MAYDFGLEHWSAEIANITGQAQFQSAVVRIVRAAPGGEWNIETGERENEPQDTLLYEGQARIIGMNASSYVQGDAQENATSLTSVRVQIPRFAVGVVEQGLAVYFISTPQNPALAGRQARITSDFQGASAATRTFSCSFDMDTADGNN